MNRKRSSWQKSIQLVLMILASTSMLLVALALSPRAHADELEDLMSAGSYVEGEAIVAYSADEGLAAWSDAPYQITPLMQVSPASVGEDAADALTGQAEQSTALSLVTSDSLTTQELLQLLADDPHVVFAEPN